MQETHWCGLTPLQRCSQCILQPQLTGQCTKSNNIMGQKSELKQRLSHNISYIFLYISCTKCNNIMGQISELKQPLSHNISYIFLYISHIICNNYFGTVTSTHLIENITEISKEKYLLTFTNFWTKVFNLFRLLYSQIISFFKNPIHRIMSLLHVFLSGANLQTYEMIQHFFFQLLLS